MRSYFRPSSPAAVSPTLVPQDFSRGWTLYSWDYWKWAANGLQPFLARTQLKKSRKKRKKRVHIYKNVNIIISCPEKSVWDTPGGCARVRKSSWNSRKFAGFFSFCGFPFINIYIKVYCYSFSFSMCVYSKLLYKKTTTLREIIHDLIYRAVEKIVDYSTTSRHMVSIQTIRPKVVGLGCWRPHFCGFPYDGGIQKQLGQHHRRCGHPSLFFCLCVFVVVVVVVVCSPTFSLDWSDNSHQSGCIKMTLSASCLAGPI